MLGSGTDLRAYGRDLELLDRRPVLDVVALNGLPVRRYCQGDVRQCVGTRSAPNDLQGHRYVTLTKLTYLKLERLSKVSFGKVLDFLIRATPMHNRHVMCNRLPSIRNQVTKLSYNFLGSFI
jgi:hypothetical protein